jgi:dihydroflavonol-4-reductase
MSQYLVTGGTGFLGHHLVSALISRGHGVTALVREGGGPLEKAGASLSRGDVLDGASVERAAAGCDGAFHCAGKVSRKPEDAEALYRIHVDGTKTTLDACRKAGVKRVVLASTSGVVAVSKDPHELRSESADAPMELIASWPYYRSKLFAEKAGLDRNGPDFEVISVNPSLLLGPGDLRGSSTGDVIDFLEGKVPAIPAGGLSFVDVRDAAEAMILAMEKGRAGERYLIGGANMTIEAFLERLSRIADLPMPKLKLPRGVLLASVGASLLERAAKAVGAKAPTDKISAEMGQCFWYVDGTKARTELGFTPRDANETLAETVADLRARGVVWPRG